MSKEEFEEQYAKVMGWTVEQFRARGGTVVECDCAQEGCPGWSADLPEDEDSFEVPLTITQWALVEEWIGKVQEARPRLGERLSKEAVVMMALHDFLQERWIGDKDQFEALWWAPPPEEA